MSNFLPSVKSNVQNLDLTQLTSQNLKLVAKNSLDRISQILESTTFSDKDIPLTKAVNNTKKNKTLKCNKIN